jgi:hypothetical protein
MGKVRTNDQDDSLVFTLRICTSFHLFQSLSPVQKDLSIFLCCNSVRLCCRLAIKVTLAALSLIVSNFPACGSLSFQSFHLLCCFLMAVFPCAGYLHYSGARWSFPASGVLYVHCFDSRCSQRNAGIVEFIAVRSYACCCVQPRHPRLCTSESRQQTMSQPLAE